MTDERLYTWYVWLDSHIRPEVYGLHLHRQVWLDTQAMLRANPDLPESYWWEFMGDTYASPKPSLCDARSTHGAT
jgi:hypothetical protein